MIYRVLVAHNGYQRRGGEDSVADSEIQLLRAMGHAVETYTRSNEEILGMSSLAMAQQTLWSDRTVRDVAALIDRFRPDVIHAHNTFPLISPSLYWAAARAGVPLVQTLHNFRLMCLNALFLREGRVCEDCMGQIPWRGVVRGCYRGSRPASAALAGMLTLHHGVGTYRNKVTRYIALNDFCRAKFIDGGLPAERVVVKPNFVDSYPPTAGPRSGFLFVGRLSAEKGIATLAEAMRHVLDAELRVAGEGPDEQLLDGLTGVTPLGLLPGEMVRAEMERTTALVIPSVCYETFGMVALEAFAAGTPVIASNIGSLATLVRDGQTGLLFEPGNAGDLAGKLAWAQAHPDEMEIMGRNARMEYEAKYTPAINYELLISIYEAAIAEMKHLNRDACGS